MRMQFDLVDRKELAPLDELNDAILAEDMKAPR
jgi:MOB kinase activator 1